MLEIGVNLRFIRTRHAVTGTKKIPACLKIISMKDRRTNEFYASFKSGNKRTCSFIRQYLGGYTTVCVVTVVMCNAPDNI